jgi:hypothetical protein
MIEIREYVNTESSRNIRQDNFQKIGLGNINSFLA